METVKITTLKGRIITLTIEHRNSQVLMGYDKFGKQTIVPIDEIKSMYSLGLTSSGK